VRPQWPPGSGGPGVHNSIPSYTSLSHTWGSDSKDVAFQDLINGTGKDKAVYEKTRFCADQARQHGLLYFWRDTCYINKENSAEPAEAIKPEHPSEEVMSAARKLPCFTFV